LAKAKGNGKVFDDPRFILCRHIHVTESESNERGSCGKLLPQFNIKKKIAIRNLPTLRRIYLKEAP